MRRHRGPPRRARRPGAAVLAVGVLAATAVLGAVARPAAAAAAGPQVTTSNPADTWTPVYDQDFPDPWVLNAGGSLFAYSTQVSLLNVPGATSPDAVHWTADAASVMPALPSWASAGRTWAPSVAEDGTGDYVMFFTADDTQLETQCIGRAVATSPAGPFVDTSDSPAFCQADLGGDIDPDIYTDAAGHSDLLWKNDGNSIGVPSGIWSQPLDDTLTPTGTPTMVLAADQAWQGGIVEGPDMAMVGGALDLFYSANAYNTAAYAIGVATCATPTGPCTDSPDNPVLTSAPGMAGPGGPSVFTGPAGQQLLAFAAWPGAVGYPQGGHRALYMATVGESEGVPTFTPDNPPSAPVPARYREVAADGGVFAFGGASFDGSAGGQTLSAPVVDSAPTPDGDGYWVASSDGGVFTYGDAPFYGSLAGAGAPPVVGITPTDDGRGYWLVTRNGGVYTFGDATFHGALSGYRGAPIVGMVPDRATGGYWLVGADGGVFSFGAPFFGSTGALVLDQPMVGGAATADDGGYWLVARDGGVFAFGDAAFDGSMGGRPLNQPVVALLPTPDGAGYWMAAADGGVFAFGDAPFEGSMGGRPLDAPVVSIDAA